MTLNQNRRNGLGAVSKDKRCEMIAVAGATRTSTRTRTAHGTVLCLVTVSLRHSLSTVPYRVPEVSYEYLRPEACCSYQYSYYIR
eukprot:scaffold125515_cov17-Prasinocladus_malaysianus.AAC.1